MKFVMIIASTLCFVVANLPAIVKVNPDGKTYTVDQYGKKFDKNPAEKQHKDLQKTFPKPEKIKPYKNKKK